MIGSSDSSEFLKTLAGKVGRNFNEIERSESESSVLSLMKKILQLKQSDQIFKSYFAGRCWCESCGVTQEYVFEYQTIKSTIDIQGIHKAVSYTHLTLPTKRIV